MLDLLLIIRSCVMATVMARGDAMYIEMVCVVLIEHPVIAVWHAPIQNVIFLTMVKDLV